MAESRRRFSAFSWAQRRRCVYTHVPRGGFSGHRMGTRA